MENDRILGDFDYPYLTSRLKRAEEHRWIGRYFNSIEVEGQDNLRALRSQQFICFSNHRSHFDYIGLAYLFLNNLRINDFPRVVAGKNLDSRILAATGLDFGRLGAFFVDREKIQSSERGERKKYLEKIKELTFDALHRGQNFVDFFEGGRNYFRESASQMKTGFMKNVIEAAEDLTVQTNPLIVCCALDYDNVIEERFFPVLQFAKKHFRSLYYATDAFAFLARPFLREGRGNMYVNFGEPRRLSQIISSGTAGSKVLQLRDHVREETIRLYKKI